MSWVERLVEERLARAAANGELDAPHLEGKPLPDLDRPRGQGWWADRFVQRELSHDRRTVAEAAAAQARAGFWRAATEDELRERVGAANAMIATANLNLIDADRLDPFDWPDIRDRWLAVRR
jgi:multidrug efflux pump subunit AcrA (membrane-fusion protein)